MNATPSDVIIPLDPPLLAFILNHPDDMNARLIAADWWEEKGAGERGEFIRVQIALDTLAAKHYQECTGTIKREIEAAPLRRRERQLLSSTVIIEEELALNRLFPTGGGRVRAWRRGFIESVILTASDFISHADEILSSNPVLVVVLTSWPEVGVNAPKNETPQVCLLGRMKCLDLPKEALQDYTAAREVVLELLKLEFPRVREWVLLHLPESVRLVREARG